MTEKYQIFAGFINDRLSRDSLYEGTLEEAKEHARHLGMEVLREYVHIETLGLGNHTINSIEYSVSNMRGHRLYTGHVTKADLLALKHSNT